ncbi:MAG: thioredoxin family protein [Hydrogenovibrio sp.]|nr:thioredoxin family protein [Hydrogenovibrio sp.]
MTKWFDGLLKRLVLIGGLLVALAPGYSQAADFFDETFGNLQEELDTAKEEGKQGIFLFFQMDDCPFCHRMETTILNQPDVIKYYKKHFLSFSIDIEGSNQLTDFDGTTGTSQEISEKKYRVRATPVLMFFDLTGKPIFRYTGPTRTKDEFMLMGKFIVEGKYKTTKFTRYKRSQSK